MPRPMRRARAASCRWRGRWRSLGRKTTSRSTPYCPDGSIQISRARRAKKSKACTKRCWRARRLSAGASRTISPASPSFWRPLLRISLPVRRLRSTADIRYRRSRVCRYSALLLRQRLGADFCDRRRRRDGFAVDGQADDRRLAAGLRLLERVGEILGAFHRDAEAAEGARVSREIRIAQIGRRDAARIFALLMHADGAVHAVVGDDGDERRAVLHGGGEFLAVHQKIAVA